MTVLVNSTFKKEMTSTKTSQALSVSRVRGNTDQLILWSQKHLDNKAGKRHQKKKRPKIYLPWTKIKKPLTEHCKENPEIYKKIYYNHEGFMPRIQFWVNIKKKTKTPHNKTCKLT